MRRVENKWLNSYLKWTAIGKIDLSKSVCLCYYHICYHHYCVLPMLSHKVRYWVPNCLLCIAVEWQHTEVCPLCKWYNHVPGKTWSSFWRLSENKLININVGLIEINLCIYPSEPNLCCLVIMKFKQMWKIDKVFIERVFEKKFLGVVFWPQALLETPYNTLA